MKWLCTFTIILSLFVYSDVHTFADNQALFGKIERNQLDTALTPGKAIICPKQENYAQAINKLLASYAFAPLLKSSTQNNMSNGTLQNITLKASAQNNLLKITAQKDSIPSEAKLVNTKIVTARTIEDILANHDLAIIIDRSGSMATKDCPGKLSRWQWCNKQASALAQAAAQASSTITVMFFNNDLQIFDNVNPTNLTTLFNSYSPAGGTILAAPLVAQLDRYFTKRAKPLIIVVITDGTPQDTSVLAPMISDASDSLHYVGEVTISFLLISNQVEPEQFRNLLGELNGGEIKNGGMIDVIDFKILAAKGIKQTLFDELKTITLATNKAKPSRAQEFAVGRSLSLNKPLNSFPFYSSNSLTNPFPRQSINAAKLYAKSK